MLFLLFDIGSHRYAVEARHVVEVLPLVDIMPAPGASTDVAGVFMYRGVSVSAIDLGQRWFGRPTPRTNARLILVEHPAARGPESRLVGLLVQYATETLRRDPANFIASGIEHGSGSASDQITTDARGIIHRVNLDTLLPAEVDAQSVDHQLQAHAAGAF